MTTVSSRWPLRSRLSSMRPTLFAVFLIGSEQRAPMARRWHAQSVWFGRSSAVNVPLRVPDLQLASWRWG
jgi:hypothetical protein